MKSMNPSSSALNGVDDALRPPLTPRISRTDGADDASTIRQRRNGQLAHDLLNRERHVRIESQSSTPASPASSIYLGSYSNASKSRVSLRQTANSPANSAPATPRMSVSSVQVEGLTHHLEPELENYGMEELRDGFFDANFSRPAKSNQEELLLEAKRTLPAAFKERHPLSTKDYFPHLLSGTYLVFRQLATTRAGIKLAKSFLAFFLSYVLCLIPVVSKWLGRYNYIMVISAILNHPGRTVGAQIDGAISTILGTATGLGWGAFALWLSSSSTVARTGYGGVLAVFMIVFMGAIAAARSYSIRLYQFVLCAGISISYTCLADTSTNVAWSKLFDYGLPWLLGQAISMLLCCAIFPDAGARPLAVCLHDSFKIMMEGLVIPNNDTLRSHRRLSNTFVSLSVAYRDLVLDISVTRFKPTDVEILRNLMQGVIRSLLALKTTTDIFMFGEDHPQGSTGQFPTSPRNIENNSDSRQSLPPFSMQDFNRSPEVTIDIDPPLVSLARTDSGRKAVHLVVRKLAEPTESLLRYSSTALERCDAVLMSMSGYRKYLGPATSVSTNVHEALMDIRGAIDSYDGAEEALLASSALPPTYSDHPEVVELFLFVRPIRQTASTIEALLVKVHEMQQHNPGWRLYLPSYPWRKAMKRTNAAVRHDRGGVTAGFFFHSQGRLEKVMKGMSNDYVPLPRSKHHTGNKSDPTPGLSRSDTLGKYQEEEENSTAPIQQKLRHKVWRVLHRLQGFESRFAFKAILVTSLLAVPAWLPQSRSWWSLHESWWAVVMSWIMLHPRVGGNFQDLITRSFCAVLGALWGGITYTVYDGNPYVMALFAAIYMVPMMYRFTQSSHPRSGIVGCLSFVVVSLSAKNMDSQTNVMRVAWTRGVAFLIGVVAAVTVNWFLWPFVARHELKKAVAAMLVYSSVIYRGVVAKYVYYEEGKAPSQADISRSEMLEGRLREGFVRIRQLLVRGLLIRASGRRLQCNMSLTFHPYYRLSPVTKFDFGPPSTLSHIPP